MIDISVVIPTFRRPALLTEALSTVLAQEGVSVEAIVVDDCPEGSAESTVDALGDERVTYMRNEPVSGGKPALVRNAGWPRARGRFVHFLDDDDKVAEGFYRATVEAFDRQPDRGVVFGRIEPFGENPKALEHERAYFADATRRSRIAAKVGSRRWMAGTLLFQNTMLVNSAGIVRRECIAPIGGYDATIPMNEDVEFYLRATRRYGAIFLDRKAVDYRILGDSLMHGREDNDKLVVAYKRMYASYRATNGSAEFLMLKVLWRTLLGWV